MKLLRHSSAVASLYTAIPLSVLLITVAQADLRVCNKTTSRVGIAVGYKAERDWVTERTSPATTRAPRSVSLLMTP